MSTTTQLDLTSQIEAGLARWPKARRDSLIPILQEVQEACGFVPREAITLVARHLGLPSSKVYGVATFYNQFRFQAPGKHRVQVCRGTACHVKGSAAVLDAVTRNLKIQPGQTTKDALFSVEVVACIGACGLAPVIAVDGEFYAGVNAEAIPAILDRYRAPVAGGVPA
jgi:NADH-quinone oxidoreductase subunit E